MWRGDSSFVVAVAALSVIVAVACLGALAAIERWTEPEVAPEVGGEVYIDNCYVGAESCVDLDGGAVVVE
jgi:hypothetical protein